MLLSLRISFLLLFPALATALRTRPARLARAATIDPALVPEFGVVAGTNPTGTGDCTGVNGILIPCSCPPDRDLFLRDLALNVAAGRAINNSEAAAISFPTGFDKASVLARLTASTIVNHPHSELLRPTDSLRIKTLQNLFGAGVGCPQAATTFGAQVKAAQALEDVPAPAAAGPAAVIATAAPVSSSSLDVALIPEFGVTAGQSPDGTGNCVGINGILIPCTCPPPRDLFIDQLEANVAAGRAVNNPGLPAAVSFPTGSDKASVLARINASTITLQNLFGPGKGCPQAAATFGAQVAAAQSLAR